MHPLRKDLLASLGYRVHSTDLCSLALFLNAGVIGGASGHDADNICWNLCWSHYRRSNPREPTATPGSAAYHFHEVLNQIEGE